MVVFFVALPLCLGIALASGAPNLFSGILAGVIGGIVVGAISSSPLSVSGPAAGLTIIVASGIESLGSYELFLAALVLAGFFQLVLGVFKAGLVGNYIPDAVISGMLAGIGLSLVVMQVPHALGFNGHIQIEGISYQVNNLEAWDTLFYSITHPHIGALIVSVLSFIVLIVWSLPLLQKFSFFKYLPGALVAVLLSVLVNQVFGLLWPEAYLYLSLRVTLPVAYLNDGYKSLLTLPDFSGLKLFPVWLLAAKLAVIASLESLLSLEASDKLDPEQRLSSPNRELIAQGAGNTLSGLLGGLPVTAVIVRSSANIVAGAKSKNATIFHGILLLLAVLLIPRTLNMIPKAGLAALLILVGYKLCSPAVVIRMYQKGKQQFAVFTATIIGILASDLLSGIGIGLILSFYFLLRSKPAMALQLVSIDDRHLIRLQGEVNFMHKGKLKNFIEHLPSNSKVELDGRDATEIDEDIIDALNDYLLKAQRKGVEVKVLRTVNNPSPWFNTIGKRFGFEDLENESN